MLSEICRIVKATEDNCVLMLIKLVNGGRLNINTLKEIVASNCECFTEVVK